MKQMKHTLLKTGRKAFMIVLAVTLALSTCVTACGVGKSGSGSGPGSIWIDSDIIGAISPDDNFREQDDFAAAANKEDILTEGKDLGIQSIVNNVLKRKRALIDDASYRNEGMDELRKYVELAEDSDNRDQQGVEPLRKYLESIEAISDLDSLYAYICDPEKNPLGYGAVIVDKVMRSVVDPTNYITFLRNGKLSLRDQANNYFTMGSDIIEAKMTVDDKVTYVLDRLGYSPADIKRILNENYAMEKIMAGNVTTLTMNDYRDLSYSRSDLKEAAGNYPLLDYLDAWGFEENERYLMSVGYVRQLDQMCSAANVNKFKSYLIVAYILACAPYLDGDTLATIMKLNVPRSEFGTKRYEKKVEEQTTDDPDEQNHEKDTLIFDQYVHSSSILTAYLNKAYVDKYFDESSRDRLQKMTEKIIETYHDIFNNEDWLSDEGKAACIEKLDEIKIHVISPDDDDLELFGMNIVPASEGGSFLDAEMEVCKTNLRKNGKLSSMPFDRGRWDPYEIDMSTTETNAFYSVQYNAIYILAGIIDDITYHEGMPDEELYGALGAVIGHEITHGFDADGVKFDKEGLEGQWMPEEDSMAFSDKDNKVASFYSTLVPYPGASLYSGTRVSHEATADMGGMRVTLKIAEGIPNFDYDKYFRSFARFFATRSSQEEEEERFDSDPHPLAFYRVNVACAQFDEFYKTYNVQPGDGMYIDEEKRIAVW